MHMKAAVLVAPNQPLEIENLVISKPGPHEVLIRTAACGLCHSDLHLTDGDLPPRYPIVGGHEGSGIIEEVGPGVTKVKPGDHVVCSFIPNCGTCRYCATGRQNLCDMGATILEGSMPDGTFRFTGGEIVGRSVRLWRTQQLKGKLASSQGDELVAQAVDVRGLKVLAARLEGADAKTLRDTMDKLKDKLKTAAIVLASVEGGKVQIAAGVTNDSTGKVKAGELLGEVARQIGGKGGGRPDMAQAGGTQPENLANALASRHFRFHPLRLLSKNRTNFLTGLR